MDDGEGGGQMGKALSSLAQRARRASAEVVGSRRWTPRALALAFAVVVLSACALFAGRGASAVPEKAVVLASYEGQHTDWLHTIPADWTIYRYVVQGREADAYLAYIIDNYDALPRYMVFLHGHRTAWHQIEPAAWKIRALNLDALDREGYINLRCEHDSGCTSDTLLGSGHPWIDFKPLRDIVGGMMSEFWEAYMTRWGFGDYPADLGQPCCAQFAVTRAAVRARPRAFYEAFRAPLGWSVAEGRERFGWNWDRYHSGTLYEYLWHVVFGKDPLHCPDAEVCRRDHFSDAIACERYPGRYQSALGWRNINCTSVFESEAHTEGLQRVLIEEVWGPPRADDADDDDADRERDDADARRIYADA